MSFDSDVLVSVLCITYNHENYIRETLEGFLMQKTNFAFEVLIHEDASTDKTAEIVREYEKKYPHIFRVIYETENQYHKGIEYNHDLLAPMARGKYLALCEGDDAWIDDEKLQLQADYMEAHPECSLTVHKSYLQYPLGWSGKRDPRSMGYEKEGIVPFEKLIVGWSEVTSSFLFRKELYMPMPKFFREAPTGDESLKFYLAAHGNVFYFDRVMSVYNRMALGSWSSTFFKESFEKQKAFYIGYLEFFEKLDAYMNFERHELIERCARERVRRFLFYLLYGYEAYDDIMGMLEGFEKACDEKWASYVRTKRQAFDLFDGTKLRKLLDDKNNDKKIFVYGAGELAKIAVRQIEKGNMMIDGIIVSDGQVSEKEFMRYPVMFLSEFLKLQNKEFLIVIAMQDTYAEETMKNLDSHGIDHYVWLFEQIYKVD